MMVKILGVVFILLGLLVVVSNVRDVTGTATRASAAWLARVWQTSLTWFRQKWVGLKRWVVYRRNDVRNAWSRWLYRHGYGSGKQIIMAGTATAMVAVFPTGRLTLEDRRVTDRELIDQLKGDFEAQNQVSETRQRVGTRWKLAGGALQIVGTILLVIG